MKIIHLSDIHGEMKYIYKFADDISCADMIIISGDSSRYREETRER